MIHIDDEHQLFIEHQISADILWDRIRPAMLAADRQSKGWADFARYAYLAGVTMRAMSAAALVLRARAHRGQ